MKHDYTTIFNRIFQIKSNMRCIETFVETGEFEDEKTIKSNMRCIETFFSSWKSGSSAAIKSNMRCIETLIHCGSVLNVI